VSKELKYRGEDTSMSAKEAVSEFEDAGGIPDTAAKRATQETVVTRVLADGEGQAPAKGNFPTDGSGLTYGRGVDMLYVTQAQLTAAGATAEEVTALIPYIGKKKTDLTASQRANTPIMRADLANSLAFNLLAGINVKIAGVKGNLSQDGIDAELSLRYWAGALGNIKRGNKLVVIVDGKRTNYIWAAVKNNTATDEELIEAIEKTRDAHTIKWKRNRLQKEINRMK
jgi:hypothetical protein